jgi:hypothetical protein
MCRGEDSASDPESEHSFDSWQRIVEASEAWERDKREEKATKRKAKREKQRLQAERASGVKPPQASLPTKNRYKLLEPKGGPKMIYAEFLRLNKESSTRPAPSRDPDLDANC